MDNPNICTRCNRNFRECWSKVACDANIRENKLNEQRRAAKRRHYESMGNLTQDQRDDKALHWAHMDVFGTTEHRP